MNDSERQQVEKLICEAEEQALRRFSDRLKETEYREHLTVRPSTIIRTALKLMEEAVRSVEEDLILRVGQITRTALAFDEIEKTVRAILKRFFLELVGIAFRACEGHPATNARSSGFDQFYIMQSDVEAELAIARPRFMSGQPIRPEESLGGTHQNKGGKPLAAHWDEMWANVAVQLWSGGLAPKTQADITQAMLNWFAAKDIDVGRTAVTERARALWLQMGSTQ